MEKAIKSDINITNVITDEVAEVDVNVVPVEDVPVHVSESVVVEGNVVPNVVVVEIDHV